MNNLSLSPRPVSLVRPSFQPPYSQRVGDLTGSAGHAVAETFEATIAPVVADALKTAVPKEPLPFTQGDLYAHTGALTLGQRLEMNGKEWWKYLPGSALAELSDELKRQLETGISVSKPNPIRP
jgi:hypothetical protein